MKANGTLEQMIKTLPDRIRECAVIVGNGDKLAKLTNIPRRTLEYYMTGASEPKASRCIAIAKCAGINLHWLLTGEGEQKILDADALQENSIYAEIPCFEASQGLQSDFEHFHDSPNKIKFLKSHLSKRNYTKDQIIAVNVFGNAMSPVLTNGDMVIVDLEKKQIINNELYVIKIENQLLIRRLQYTDVGNLEIIAENNSVCPNATINKEQASNLFIVGKVIWIGAWE